MKLLSNPASVALVAFCGALLIPTRLIAQDSVPKKADATKEETVERKLIDGTISDLKFHLGDNTKPMESRVMLRWPNPVRQVEDGATAIWIEKGRPQAVCCVWTDRGYLSFCFGLLSSGPVRAELDGRSLWHPKRPGPSITNFRPIPDAPVPAKTAPVRLRQMKELARRFRSNMVDPAANHESLRLLPSPLYRYEIPDGQDKQSEVSDGALFAFVMGTDPESLLMIESRRASTGDQWQFSAAKRTDGLVEVFLDDKLVDSLATRCVPYDTESDFTCLHRPAGKRQK
jgi:hypothetical protein